MTPEAWLTLGIIAITIGLLVYGRISADIVLTGGLSLLVILGVISPGAALVGFANEGVITVAVLYVVVAGLKETGGLSFGQVLLGRPRRLAGAQLRLMVTVALFSSVLNNTPVVAMMIPLVQDLAQKLKLSASKLLLPLSYAAILGGTCTLIGTSTNLVVNGLYTAQTGRAGLSLFEITLVGLPSTLVGIVFITLTGRWLLPDRKDRAIDISRTRNYTFELEVDPQGPLVGKTIEAAGLRQLARAFLVEIDRDNQTLVAVSPDEVLQAGDRLVFAGIVEAIKELGTIRGLTVVDQQVSRLSSPSTRRRFVEAVVSDSCPLLGRSIRAGRFRSVYDAVVIAAARGGQRLNMKLGDVVLQRGDTLLLETTPAFIQKHRYSRDFYLVSPLADTAPIRHERAFMALGILLLMVMTVVIGLLNMLQAALLAAGLMLVTRCLTGAEARRSVDYQVIIVIATAFGLGQALELTGAAAVIAGRFVTLASGNPWWSLTVIYAVTTLFTSVITNNGAAAIIFPIAYATSVQLGVSPLPFVIAIMMAASASFATPISYQTNLMVYGPGGYRFADYLRAGLPLNLITGLIAVLLIPLLWPF